MSRRKTVLQVGDIANVATDLSDALRHHSNWDPVQVDVATVRRRSKASRLADLPIRARRTRAAVRTAIGQCRPDIVHLHWARYAPFIGTEGVPLVVHVHGSDVRNQADKLTGRLVHRSMSQAGVTLVSTPDLMTDTPAGSRYLPNPIDVGLFSPGDPDGGERPPSASPNDPERRPVVLIFARLRPIKGARSLLASAAAIRAIDPGATVLALGGGELDDDAADAGVQLLPARHRLDLPGLLRSVDVVMGQQRLGILSLSELEAMACGRPVIMPLRRELYGADAPTVDAVEPRDVAERCLELAADAARRQAIGAASRDYVIRNHEPAAVARQLVDVYEGLLATRS